MGLIPKFLLSKNISLIKTTPKFEGGYEYSTALTYKARVEIYNSQNYDSAGDLKDCKWIFYIDGDVSLKTDDVLQFEGINYKVVQSDKHYWTNGNIDHTKVYVK